MWSVWMIDDWLSVFIISGIESVKSLEAAVKIAESWKLSAKPEVS